MHDLNIRMNLSGMRKNIATNLCIFLINYHQKFCKKRKEKKKVLISIKTKVRDT